MKNETREETFLTGELRTAAISGGEVVRVAEFLCYVLDKRRLLIAVVAAVAREEPRRGLKRVRSPNSDVSDVKHLTRCFRDWAQRMSKET